MSPRVESSKQSYDEFNLAIFGASAAGAASANAKSRNGITPDGVGQKLKHKTMRSTNNKSLINPIKCP